MHRSIPGTVLAALLAVALSSQTVASAQEQAVVPHVTQFSGTAAQAGTLELRFALYSAEKGGEALWSETQTVTTDSKGRYQVLLGSGTTSGLPQSVFSSGEAKWLGISVGSGEEAPRTVLVATPYSLKASDAETIGGHPASDFLLVAKDASGKPETGTPITQINTSSGILGGGTGPTLNLTLDGTYLANYGNSAYAQLHAANTFSAAQTINGNLTVNGTISGTGVVGSIVAGAAVDVTKSGSAYTIALDGPQALAFGNTYWAQLAAANTFKAAQTFQVPVTFASAQTFPGTAVLGLNHFTGAQTLEPTQTATTSTGYSSNALGLFDSIYSTSSSAAISQGYVWQTEPLNNDSASPLSTLNLQYSNGVNRPAETGFYFGPDGHINFAAGQTFPGAGTITGLTAGTGLSGGGTSGAVTLSLNTSYLNTNYAGLNASNTFTSPQTLTSTETISGSNATELSVADYSSTGTAIYATGAIGVRGISGTATGTGVVGNGGASQGGTGVNATGFTALNAVGSTTGPSGSLSGDGTGVNASGYIGVVGAGATTAQSGYLAGTGVYATGYNGVVSYSNGATGYGVYASGVTGVQAVGGTATGNSGLVGTGYYGASLTGTDVGLVTSGENGVNASGTYIGITANSTGTTTGLFSGIGVFSTGSFAGVYGSSSSSTGLGVFGSSETGVEGGSTDASYGLGVHGQLGSPSSIAASFGKGAAIWGDAGAGTNAYIGGVLGTADDNIAGWFENKGAALTMIVQNLSTAASYDIALFEDSNFNSCIFENGGKLSCTGAVSVVPAREDGRKVEMYSPSATENWMEDYGTGHIEAGSGHVALDKDFAAMANAGVEYHVFLTPRGDCNGLYVGSSGPEGFDVRELKGGNSTLSFDYKIVAKRRGMESVRMRDVTEERAAQAAWISAKTAAVASAPSHPEPRH